jgi:hypothetical protein
MRAQSRSSRAFGFMPLEEIALREEVAGPRRRTIFKIGREPGTFKPPLSRPP